MKEYDLEDLDYISQFFVEGQYRHRKTYELAKCQIRGCKCVASWIQNLKKENKSIFICWKHHEEVSDLHVREKYRQ